VKEFFTILRPELLILSQSDTWPVLLTQARKHLDKGAIWIPHKEESAKWSREKLLKPLVKTIALRREKMKSPLVQTSTVFVGSPRIDRILNRIEDAKDKEHPLKEIIEKNNKPKIILASAWKEDAFIWMKALEKSSSLNDFDLYLIPHDIHDPNEVISLSGFFPKKTILKEGILLESYKNFDLAYVGGGFRTGLHNIVEPLAWGIPTLCGADLRKQPEAPDFVAMNALTPLKDEAELSSFLEKWKNEKIFRDEKIEAAKKAQSQLLQQKGASKRLADLIGLYE
jgi:3-deoxy-D-manno-octulosonic-acid transferase